MREILAFDPYADATATAAQGVKLVDLDTLVAQSDFVSVHCPLNDSTRDLIGPKQFGLMRPDAYLINTARGGIVNEDALYEALQHGRIAGAAMDCFVGEPLSRSAPFRAVRTSAAGAPFDRLDGRDVPRHRQHDLPGDGRVGAGPAAARSDQRRGARAARLPPEVGAAAHRLIAMLKRAAAANSRRPATLRTRGVARPPDCGKSACNCPTALPTIRPYAISPRPFPLVPGVLVNIAVQPDGSERVEFGGACAAPHLSGGKGRLHDKGQDGLRWACCSPST